MNPARHLVLDANILLRGVFGDRVRRLFSLYEDSVIFCTPENCFAEARRSVPAIAARRDADPVAMFELLHGFSRLVRIVADTSYAGLEPESRERIFRDPSDWPIVATALLLDCPIWTEDHDFFGCGIATWTTTTVELYLRAN